MIGGFKMPRHQAAEQMTGYLYQVRYALQLLLENENDNYRISIEKFDDVSFHDSGTPKELIQLKHHLNRAGSLSDSSVDLWRTLKVWLDMVSEDCTILQSSDFFLVTTSSVREESVSKILSENQFNGEEEIRNVYNRLKEVAETSTNETNKSFYQCFLRTDKNLVLELLSHVTIIPKADTIVDSEKRIRKIIRYSCRPRQEDFIYERLEGWWFRKVINFLTSDQPQFVDQQQVRNKINDISNEYRDDNLPVDEDIEFFDISREDNSINEIFLEQLHILNIKNILLKSASNDYYRACKQRTRWVRDELIYLDELAKYDIKLISEWEIAFAWMEDFLGNEVNINDEEKIKAGKKLYKEMMDKNIYIREHCQKPFIMRGSYHILANKLKVGWHIDYKEILKHLLEEKKDRND